MLEIANLFMNDVHSEMHTSLIKCYYPSITFPAIIYKLTRLFLDDHRIFDRRVSHSQGSLLFLHRK